MAVPTRTALAPADIQRALDALQRALPYGQAQDLSVTFNSTSDVDTIIPHSLVTDDWEAIDYTIIGVEALPGAAFTIYRDPTPTRKPWGKGYLVLRSSVGGIKVRLRLTTRSTS